MEAVTDVPRRGAWAAVLLRIVLAALSLSTCAGLWFAVTNRPEFEAAFPGAADGRIYAGLLLLGGLGLVAVVGLWRWRRWAVVLYGLVVLADLVMDVLADAPVVHQGTVLVGGLLVGSLLFLNRARFAADAP